MSERIKWKSRCLKAEQQLHEYERHCTCWRGWQPDGSGPDFDGMPSMQPTIEESISQPKGIRGLLQKLRLLWRRY
jgi:hypothetical protein